MINSVVLVGRLTRDPELRKTTSGTSVTSFTIAVDERKGTEKTTMYMNCTAFNMVADSVVKFCRKGSLVGVAGRLTQRKYLNKQNVEVTTTEIVASQVEFLTPKGDKPTDPSGFVSDVPAEEPVEEPAQVEEENDVTNDDLPF